MIFDLEQIRKVLLSWQFDFTVLEIILLSLCDHACVQPWLYSTGFLLAWGIHTGSILVFLLTSSSNSGSLLSDF